MKYFNIIKLYFKSPLHLSKGREDYGVAEKMLHSDTLQSALFVSALQLYGDSLASREFFESFQVSSAFPFFRDTYFLPKPQADQYLFADLSDEDRKKAKKIAYLPIDDFERVINGQKLPFNEYRSKNIAHEFKIQNEVYQHVSIPRFGGQDANPYYMDRLYFEQETGFYFILKFKDNAPKEKILSALALLGENGLGTDRNVGNGNFEFEHIENGLKLNVPDEADYQYNLALYCPKDNAEMPNLDKSYYTLLKRGGWIANPENENNASLRKKSVYMFGEGSVFPKSSSQDLVGKIVELQPAIMQEHKIWRDGRGLFISCKIIE